MEIRKEWTIFIVGFVMPLVIGISFALAASDYPTRYIDLIVPAAPGGGTDVTWRLFQDKVEKILGKPIVANYKPGGTGVVAFSYVKECKPDGYTLMVVSTIRLLFSQLAKTAAPYTIDDFTPICFLTLSPSVISVGENSPYKTLQDFIQAAKTKKMKYSVNEAISPNHLIMETLSKAAGFRATAVPFGGSAPAMTALLGGHVDISVSGATPVGAKLRLLAVAGDKRSELYPEVPCLKEIGYPGIKGEIYMALWGPKGIPREVVDKIYGAYKKAFEENREEFAKRAKAGDQIVYLSGPEEVLKTYQENYVFYSDAMKKLGLGKEK